MLFKVVSVVIDELKNILHSKELSPGYKQAIFNAIDALESLRRFW